MLAGLWLDKEVIETMKAAVGKVNAVDFIYLGFRLWKVENPAGQSDVTDMECSRNRLDMGKPTDWATKSSGTYCVHQNFWIHDILCPAVILLFLG